MLAGGTTAIQGQISDTQRRSSNNWVLLQLCSSSSTGASGDGLLNSNRTGFLEESQRHSLTAEVCSNYVQLQQVQV
jgi:hypothetical protein